MKVTSLVVFINGIKIKLDLKTKAMTASSDLHRFLALKERMEGVFV